jgi:hypothetical protein
LNMSISANYAKIRQEIPDYITIVVSCKTRTPEEMITYHIFRTLLLDVEEKSPIWSMFGRFNEP